MFSGSVSSAIGFVLILLSGTDERTPLFNDLLKFSFYDPDDLFEARGGRPSEPLGLI